MKFGVTDLPLMVDGTEENNMEDLLDISKYIRGLKKFITACPTPMSIAIQGDWGTGKTSIINCLNNELIKSDNIKTIYFNTWQYSQFSMDENLYFSFLTCLMEKMNKDSIGQKLQGSAKDILKFLLKTGKKMIPYGENIDENAALDIFFKTQLDKAQSIAKVRDEFQKTVETYLGDKGNRLVIFIDDLDRLNPGVAVELLETIKLFLDVRQCVFILAIDYDVVVQGVRKKFGSDVSIEKCKSFFDKIIQLPFHMPVESYSIKKLMETYLSSIISDQYIKPLSKFVEATVGANPRTFKRLVNSFLLIQCVLETKGEDESGKIIGELEAAMILSALCLQMSVTELYTYLLTSSGWLEDEDQILYDEAFETKQTSDELSEIFKEYVLDYKELTDRKVDQIAKAIESLGVVLKKLYELDASQKDDNKEFLSHFKEVISMSSITSVPQNASKNIDANRRKASVAVKQIVVEGVKSTVKDATEAIVQTFQIVLSNHKELLPLCKEKILMITDDETKKNSVFRSKSAIKIGEEIIYIGTSTGFPDKCKYADKLCMLCKLPEGSIIWGDGNQVVYENKNKV